MAGPTLGWTLGDWISAYENGLSATDAITALVAQYDRADSAWIVIAEPDQIRHQLIALHKRLAAHDGNPKALPLYGIPFAVKDNIDVQGWQTTAACPTFAYTASASSPVVERLCAAGAILVGKTNMDQFATGLNGTRSPYGAVPNSFQADYISGGSSSGSASVVARGLVPFALGTDTAGSGRVPAGLNNIVGLKPTRGWFSTRHVVPACRTLDCVSLFALTVTDCALLTRIAGGYDDRDPYARPHPQRAPAAPNPVPRLAIPSSLEFFGDTTAAQAFQQALCELSDLGATITPIDFAPFLELATLLYGGPWLAERTALLGPFLRSHPQQIEPAVHAALKAQGPFSAEQVFLAEYRRAELSRLIRQSLDPFDALVVPTTPTIYKQSELQREPLLLNSRLGHYTNFANLADLCALAVPSVFRSDGLPAGVTFLAPAWHDQALMAIGQRFQDAQKLPLGATGRPNPMSPAAPATECLRLAVVGAHMRGMPLNDKLVARHARFLKTVRTAPCYRLYALATDPPKPSLVKRPTGAAIEVEIWELPLAYLGEFLAEIPAPLCIGTIDLEDGGTVKGFLGEYWACDGVKDITAFGGWRNYLEDLKSPSSEDDHPKTTPVARAACGHDNV